MRFSPIFLSLTCFSSVLIASNISITDSEIVNNSGASFAQGYDSVTMVSGTITNAGVFAEEAGTVTVSGGLVTNSGFFAGSVTNAFTLSGDATLVNTGTVSSTSTFIMTGGTIDNSGVLGNFGTVTISDGSVSFNSGSKVGELGTVTIGTITFTNASGAELGTSARIVDMTATSLTNDGSVGFNAATVTMYNSNLTNTGSFAEGVSQNLIFTNVIGTNTGLIGTVADFAIGTSSLANTGTVIATGLTMTNATISNDGFMHVGTSTLTSNQITGTGTFVLTGTIFSSIPITQNTVYVGTGSDSAYFQTNQNIIADVNVIGSVSELRANGNITISNLNAEGVVNPGLDAYNTLNITNQGTLTDTAMYLVDINRNTQCDQIIVGNDFELGSANLDIRFPNGIKSGTSTYTILSSSGGSINGSFGTITYPGGMGTVTVSVSSDQQNVYVTTFSDTPGTVTWTGSASDLLWLNPANWLDDIGPTPFDAALFTPEYQLSGTIALAGGTTYTGSASAANLQFIPNLGNYSSFVFTGDSGNGDLYLNGTGSGSTLISGGGEQDFSQVNIHILNALPYVINTGGSFTFNNIDSDYPGGEAPSLTFQGTSTYLLIGTVGESFTALNFSNVTLNGSGAVIGSAAGSIDLTGATVSLTDTKIGNNLVLSGTATSGDLTFNGGSLGIVGNTEIGVGAQGTISVSDLDFTIPVNALFGNDANNLLFTNATVQNTGSLAVGATAINFASGSISNAGNFANNVQTLTINASTSFYNSGTAGNNTNLITVAGSFTNDGSFGVNATTISGSGLDIVNNGTFGGDNATSIQINNAWNLIGTASFGAGANEIIAYGSVTNQGDFGTDVPNIQVTGNVIQNSEAQFGYQTSDTSTAFISIGGYVSNNGSSSFGYQAEQIIVGGYLSNQGDFGSNNASGLITITGTLQNAATFGSKINNFILGSDVINTGTCVDNILFTPSATSRGTVTGNVDNSGRFVTGFSILSIGGSVANTSVFGQNTGSITVGLEVSNNGGSFGTDADYISVGGFVYNAPSANFGYQGAASNATITIGGTVENGVNAYLGYGAQRIETGSISNAGIFGGINTDQQVIVTGSINNSGSFAISSKLIQAGDVANSGTFGTDNAAAEITTGNVQNIGSGAFFGDLAATITVTGSVYTGGAFGSDALYINVSSDVNNTNYFAVQTTNAGSGEIIIGGDVINSGAFAKDVASLAITGTVDNTGDMAYLTGSITTGSISNTQNFAVQNSSSNAIVLINGSVINGTGAAFATNCRTVTAQDVENYGDFANGNTLGAISVANVINTGSGANFANNVATLTVNGDVTSTGTMGQNVGTITVSSNVINTAASFGCQDSSSSTSNLSVTGDVQNRGISANFAYQAGTISILGSVYNEGVFGGTNTGQNISITGSVYNLNELGNGISSAIIGTTSLYTFINGSTSSLLNGTANALNNVSGTITLEQLDITNYANGVLASNAGALTITAGSISNLGSLGVSAGTVILTGGTFINSSLAFNNATSIHLEGALGLTNNAAAEFGKNAQEILINSGSITNDGSFGEGASITLENGAYFENTSTVGQIARSGRLNRVLFKSSPLLFNSSNFQDQSGDGLIVSEIEEVILFGQAEQTSTYLSSLISGFNAPQATQNDYNLASTLPQTQQEAAFFQMSPQFKVIQFAQEKLDLLLHKELQLELYQKEDKNRIFVLGGYDAFHQEKKNGYAGYNVNNFYQLVGATAHYGNMKWLTSIGASESYMDLDPTKSSASYPAIWGSLGVSSQHKNWIYGIDGLFGYNFVDTKRKVDFLNQTATSKHGLWSISFDTKLGYCFRLKSKEKDQEKEYMRITPYDIFGYLYGHELAYSEKGTSGNNYQVKNENISVIRNQLGVKIDYLFKTYYTAFLDTAWLYDYYTNNNIYQAAIVGTNVFGNFTQALPTKNYGRIQAGFIGDYQKFDWKVSYTGLYGKYLQDSSISLRFGYKF